MHESSEEPDLGAADPAVGAALAGYRDRTIGAASVLAALAKSRLLVPVVAVLDTAETTAGGASIEKSSHMATVSTTGRDGRRGLLAFTSLESLRRWRPDARPVPAPAPAVAAAALDEGADAVVVDLAGPVQFAIDSRDLQASAGPGLSSPGSRLSPHRTRCYPGALTDSSGSLNRTRRKWSLSHPHRPCSAVGFSVRRRCD
jgi:hypothetical protein